MTTWRQCSVSCAKGATRCSSIWSMRRCIGLPDMAARPKLRHHFRSRAVDFGHVKIANIHSVSEIPLSPRARFRLILVDANILIYPRVSSFVQHQPCSDCCSLILSYGRLTDGPQKRRIPVPFPASERSVGCCSMSPARWPPISSCPGFTRSSPTSRSGP